MKKPNGELLEPQQNAVTPANAEILEELKRIQSSHAFGNSARAKEFLDYVVQHGLEGDTELLKERSIGIHVFNRTPAYITSEDPIVRVKAAEVRRRLAQYYTQEELNPGVRIEIPVGSYVPKFHWNRSVADAAIVPIPVTNDNASDNASPPFAETPKLPTKKWIVVAAVATVCVLAAVARHMFTPAKSMFETFWAPASTGNDQVLICIPTPVSYAVSSELYQKGRTLHPGSYNTQTERENTPLQLDPETDLKWKNLTPLVDYYVNKDDAYVAADLSALFGRLGKGSQVRMGHDFSYEDLRHSPAVLVGAFDNIWTIRVGAELPFVFREEDGAIAERGGKGRIWRMDAEKNRGPKDYAIVARVLNSKTGQFLVIVGGVGMVGTQAAGSFISQPGDLDKALQKLPPDWKNKNLEMVLETDVIDAAASRPQVVAYAIW
jgi:hypothetical protein